MEIQFGDRLAKLRREASLSQRKLAQDLKLSQALLSHYENSNREPSLLVVCRVCDYFGVSADFILGRETPSGSSDGEAPLPSNLPAGDNSPEVRRESEAYLRAARRRLSALVGSEASPLNAAQAALDMAQAELNLIQAQNK
ncbi:MAG: helix-turn-helix domain-containing protein [Oscillospiraceae bacterium]|nr:helix-turn-helix domain-containing protein [Oscillospiraceae bacterium]